MAPVLQALNFVLAFALVLALAYWTARFLGGHWGFRARGRWLRVVEALPVGRDRALLLLDVAGRFLLVGMGPQGFHLLTSLDDPDTVARLAAPPSDEGGAGGAGFRQALERLLGRRGGPGGGADGG